MDFIGSLDESIIRFANSLLISNNAAGAIFKFFSLYLVYFIPIIWLVWWFVSGKKQRYVLLSAMLAGVLAWQVLNRFVKLLYERPRPVHELSLKEFLFERPENSFPSDHAAFLSAIAFFFFLRGQKVSGRWLMAVALLASSARVAVAVHYPSDIVMGFIDGFLVAWVVNLLHGRLSETVWEWCLKLAQRLRLA